MFFTKLKKSLFTLSTLEYWGIAATLVVANYYSWQDELDHVALTRILASGHTIFTFVKVIDNLKRAYIENEDKLPLFSTTLTFSAGSAASITGVWVTNDPMLNFVSGVANASCNFFSKYITNAYRKNVDDIVFPPTTNDPNAVHVDSLFEADLETSPSELSLQASTPRSTLLTQTQG